MAIDIELAVTVILLPRGATFVVVLADPWLVFQDFGCSLPHTLLRHLLPVLLLLGLHVLHHLVVVVVLVIVLIVVLVILERSLLVALLLALVVSSIVALATSAVVVFIHW